MWHFIKHFMTITRHRHKVMYHCLRCGILWQGMRHDLSKYSPTEFLPGARFYLGDRSPTEGERREYGYSKAWMHHKGRNKHHLEYWIDYSADKSNRQLMGMKMPVKYVVEMFCDRVAASKNYNRDEYTDAYPLNYYLRGRSRDLLHPESAKLLESMLAMLAEKGEDFTFDYIRREILHNRK